MFAKVELCVHPERVLHPEGAQALLRIAANARDVAFLLRVLRMCMRYQVQLGDAAHPSLFLHRANRHGACVRTPAVPCKSLAVPHGQIQTQHALQAYS